VIITRARRAGPVTAAAWWPAGMVRLAARALPKGAVRDRYRAEFLAELYGLRRWQQTRDAIGVLSCALALRTAVTSQQHLSGGLDNMTSKTKTRPLLCRLNLHHEWKRRTTEDGARFRQCARCRKDDSRGSGPMDSGGFGAGIS
jgi:hypothetical protein